MDEQTMILSVAGMGALMLFPVGRKVVKGIFAIAIGLFLLLLLCEPRLD